MASSIALKPFFVVVVLVVFVFATVAPPQVEAAISCNQVTTFAAPCLNYLLKGGALPAACCNSVRSLSAAVKTKPDRRTACNCMRMIASKAPGIKHDLATALPGKCGVNFPFKISMSTDCSKVI